ncbi:MAG: aldehyde dehydrogenase family protein [Acidobacteria bacterium]|nr:aldehyde dehydrogenase family protein [Acidobacteriota bacterium]
MNAPVLLAGHWTTLPTPLDVLSPFDGRVVGRTSVGQDADFEVAAAAAVAATDVMRRWPSHARITTLRAVAAALRADHGALALTIADEAGKPLRDARTEVERAAFTFDTAADEVSRLGGELLPIDLMPHGEGRLALTRRVPLGPIAAITPFNFPLLLAAHKLAPALAAGNPIVLKPATKTPLTALHLARLLHDHGVPPGGLSVLPLARATADRLVTDDRFRLLTFTGSGAVGWAMKARAGRKRVVLELGGNAGVIVDATADLDLAVSRIVAGGFTFAGQSCISVQRVYVHDAVAEPFTDRLVRAVAALKVGDPRDPAHDIGPMITHGDVDRIESWVRDAVADGARVLTGGQRLSASLFAATVIDQVPTFASLCREEAFAPIVGLYRFSKLDDAITAVNTSRYGLQAGIFTEQLGAALTAFDRLEVGGVLINDVPTWRMDSMPYGGTKDSGTGREGPRYAIEEMTDLKLLVINQRLERSL